MVENESLCAKLHDLNVVNDSLRYENSVLVDKVKSLEDDLVVCKSDFSNISGIDYDCILSSQKPIGYKCGYVFFYKSASAPRSTHVNKGIFNLVPLSCVDDVCATAVNKGKGALVSMELCATVVHAS